MKKLQILATQDVQAIDLEAAMSDESIYERDNELVVDSNSGLTSVLQDLKVTNWLPFCAKEYRLPHHIQDYIIIPVPIFPSDIPNGNGIGFPLKQLLRFMPDYGLQSFKTWIGKPTFVDHDNQDYTKAVGVIMDSVLRPMPEHGQGNFWKLVQLLSVSKTKTPDLAQALIDRKYNSFSMGSYVLDGYTCSLCEALLGSCTHLHPKAPMDLYRHGKNLVYRNANGIVGFETSIVTDVPAWKTAVSDTLIEVDANVIPGYDQNMKYIDTRKQEVDEVDDYTHKEIERQNDIQKKPLFDLTNGLGFNKSRY